MEFIKNDTKNLVYKHLNSGMDEISAIWKNAPFRYRIKFMLKKDEIKNFIKKNAKKQKPPAIQNQQSRSENSKNLFFSTNFAYSYYVVCGLKKFLPKRFNVIIALQYLPLALQTIIEKYGVAYGINSLICRKLEIASYAIQLYKEDNQKKLNFYPKETKQNDSESAKQPCIESETQAAFLSKEIAKHTLLSLLCYFITYTLSAGILLSALYRFDLFDAIRALFVSFPLAMSSNILPTIVGYFAVFVCNKTIANKYIIHKSRFYCLIVILCIELLGTILHYYNFDEFTHSSFPILAMLIISIIKTRSHYRI